MGWRWSANLAPTHTDHPLKRIVMVIRGAALSAAAQPRTVASVLENELNGMMGTNCRHVGAAALILSRRRCARFPASAAAKGQPTPANQPHRENLLRRGNVRLDARPACIRVGCMDQRCCVCYIWR